MPIQGLYGRQQLAAKTSSSAPDREHTGHLCGRSFCRSAEHSQGEICQLETRSPCDDGGHIQLVMEKPGSICISPILPNREVLIKDSQGPSNSDSYHTDMADANLVSKAVGNGSGNTDFTSTISRPVDRPRAEQPPTHRNQTADVGGMENLRDRLIAMGLSADSSALFLQSRRPGTQSAYKAPWNKWVSWCGQREINAIQADVADVANFLTDQLQRGLKYSTLNCYRSAISAYHPEIEGYKMGQHPLIKQLMQGAFNRNPPKPRYSDTWDVEAVLAYIKRLGSNTKLSRKELTHKLAILMALVSACRGSELHKLKPPVMTEKTDEVTSHIAGLTKSKRPSKPHVSVVFHTYEEDTNLAVIDCLKAYLRITQSSRLLKEQKESLFLSYKAPFNPVATCSIARWLKVVMTEAGINTDVFKAHSTRAASTSKAQAQGLSTSQIIERANWTKGSTFF